MDVAVSSRMENENEPKMEDNNKNSTKKKGKNSNKQKRKRHPVILMGTIYEIHDRLSVYTVLSHYLFNMCVFNSLQYFVSIILYRVIQ